MSTTRAEPVSEVEVPPHADRIRIAVLRALGRPPELLRVSVRPVWGNKFRVNVWAAGGNGAAIPNSDFVAADEQGNVFRSGPAIQKRY